MTIYSQQILKVSISAFDFPPLTDCDSLPLSVRLRLSAFNSPPSTDHPRLPAVDCPPSTVHLQAADAGGPAYSTLPRAGYIGDTAHGSRGSFLCMARARNGRSAAARPISLLGQICMGSRLGRYHVASSEQALEISPIRRAYPTMRPTGPASSALPPCFFVIIIHTDAGAPQTRQFNRPRARPRIARHSVYRNWCRTWNRTTPPLLHCLTCTSIAVPTHRHCLEAVVVFEVGIIMCIIVLSGNSFTTF